MAVRFVRSVRRVVSPKGNRSATITAGITKNTPSERLPPTVCGAGSSVALSIPHDAPDQRRFDRDEDRRGQDQDDHVQLMNILTLGRDPLLRAVRQQQQRAVRAQDEPVPRGSVRIRVDPVRADQVTVNVNTMPFEAWGGPFVLSTLGSRLPAREEVLPRGQIEHVREGRPRIDTSDLTEGQVLGLALAAALAPRNLRTVDDVLRRIPGRERLHDHLVRDRERLLVREVDLDVSRGDRLGHAVEPELLPEDVVDRRRRRAVTGARGRYEHHDGRQCEDPSPTDDPCPTLKRSGHANPPSVSGHPWRPTLERSHARRQDG